jgi:hypothetical protein
VGANESTKAESEVGEGEGLLCLAICTSWEVRGASGDEVINLEILEFEEDNYQYRLMVEAVESVGGRCKVVLS